jgi:hypothetical protein
MNLAG